MDVGSQTKRRRLGWQIVGGVAIIAILGLALAKLRFRPATRPAAATQAAGPPVLLITIDTLRADHVGCYGYREVETPAIDFLAAQGVRFDEAVAQVPLTPPSHIVILSGTYPMWNGVRDYSRPQLRKNTQFITEAFGRHGYVTAAFISSMVLNATWGLNRGFQTYDAEFKATQADAQEALQRRAGESIDRLLSWFRVHDPRAKGARPFFIWLHLYDPHLPYDPPEPFHTQYASHLYDGEIAYADSQLGRLFDYLRQIGFYDRTLIVLLSDHGESLGEHGEEDHGYFVYRSTVRVPLIIKLPHQGAGGDEARVIQPSVGTIDVAPTVLELAHIQDPISRQFQGSSLASMVLGKKATGGRPVYSENYEPRNAFGWSPLYSITTDRYQYIAAPHPELYDLTEDASEKHNVHVQRRAEAATLRDTLQDIQRRYTDTGSSSSAAASLPPDMVEKLKSLGYVAYSAPLSPASDKDLPDPKEKLPVYLAWKRAQALANAGQFEASDALLKPLLAKDPSHGIVPLQLGTNAVAENHWAEAERYFRATLKLNPQAERAIAGLAQAANAQGKVDESRQWLELEISQNPRDYVAYSNLGQLARDRLDLEEARRDFEKAVALEPSYAPAQVVLGLTLVDAERYNEAVKPLEAAVSLGINDPQVFSGLATAYFNTHQPKMAIVAARKGLAARGDPAAARLNHALGELAAGDRRDALNDFHSLCNDDPADCLEYEKFFK